MQRFWERAEPVCDDGRTWSVLLDGKPLRLPSRAPLRVPSSPLAAAIAQEWQQAGGGKGRDVSLDALPLTRLVGTAIDRIAPDPGPVIDEIARYGETDLLCYRAAFPAALAQRQHEAWQPLLDWTALALDAPLAVTAGVVAVTQPPAACAALRRAVAAHTPIALSALGLIVQQSGSLVLGLAVSHGRLDATGAHALSLLDETWQAEEWGIDHEAAARREAIAADIALAARLLSLAREGQPA